MKISVLTATYNRANKLKKLYESIVNNIDDSYEIEWLIMDDGSEDDTKNICTQFISKKGLTIKYYYQHNQGKMQAINNLVNYSTGDLIIECDSDDFFIDKSFFTIKQMYEQNKNRKDIYAFLFLKQDQNGNNMGQDFKSKENTMFDLYFKHGETGEKAIVFIADIRKKYTYELENNETFVTEARMYHKMDKNYKVICENKYIMVCEYQQDGYSKNINKQFIKNPYGYYKYFYEILKDMDTKHILFLKRLYVVKHFILFSYVTKQKCMGIAKNICDRLLITLMYVPGRIKSKHYKNVNLK